MRFFEDLPVGETREFGTYAVTEDEVLEFGKRWDPQPFHVDPDVAEDTIYDGLIASGWHTAAMATRLLVDNYLSDIAAMGSPGVGDLGWLAPVRPGDELSVRTEIVTKRPLESRPDRGMVHVAVTASNEAGDDVLSFELRLLVERAASS